jgi:hypothetical protein
MCHRLADFKRYYTHAATSHMTSLRQKGIPGMAAPGYIRMFQHKDQGSHPSVDVHPVVSCLACRSRPDSLSETLLKVSFPESLLHVGDELNVV